MVSFNKPQAYFRFFTQCSEFKIVHTAVGVKREHRIVFVVFGITLHRLFISDKDTFPFGIGHCFDLYPLWGEHIHL